MSEDSASPPSVVERPDYALAVEKKDPGHKKFPYLRPKPAATLIILDHTGKESKVLMGRRHHGHKFMPGKFVFPGGRVDPADREVATACPLHPKVAEKLAKRRVNTSAALPRALALAAIRETFEETGLALGATSSEATAALPPRAWADYAAHGLTPNLAAFHFITRAITPPRRPRRFDTCFFAVDAKEIAARVEDVIHPESELVELVWLPLDEARKLDLPHITGVVLRELKTRIDGGMGHDLPVPFYYERHKRWFREEL
jgi:8-oxo-dGTP pyrophosphatase MutT (NUDIX family)